MYSQEKKDEWYKIAIKEYNSLPNMFSSDYDSAICQLKMIKSYFRKRGYKNLGIFTTQIKALKEYKNRPKQE